MEVMLMTSVMNFEEVFASPVLLAIIKSPWNDTYLEIQPPGTEKNSFFFFLNLTEVDGEKEAEETGNEKQKIF